MSKRPSFQFYPADWLFNANLQRCTLAEQGAWLRVMCLLHDQDEYGLIHWPLAEIATATGLRTRILHTLARKLVLKGHDLALAEPYTFVPIHGGKRGPAVVLIPAQEGPLWFCSRMVVDEYKRQVRGQGTRFEASPNPQPMSSIGVTPKPPFGYGASSSSSSSLRNPLPNANPNPVYRTPAPRKSGDSRSTKAKGTWDPWARHIPDVTDEPGLKACARAYGFNHEKCSSWGEVRDACFTARRRLQHDREREPQAAALPIPST